MVLSNGAEQCCMYVCSWRGMEGEGRGIQANVAMLATSNSQVVRPLVAK